MQGAAYDSMQFQKENGTDRYNTIFNGSIPSFHSPGTHDLRTSRLALPPPSPYPHLDNLYQQCFSWQPQQPWPPHSAVDGMNDVDINNNNSAHHHDQKYTSANLVNTEVDLLQHSFGALSQQFYRSIYDTPSLCGRPSLTSPTGAANANRQGRGLRSNFPEYVTNILRRWLDDNLNCPYPSLETKKSLVGETGLTLGQVSFVCLGIFLSALTSSRLITGS